MKKQIDLQLLAVCAGGLLFNYLFWMERLGLNLIIYSVFIFIIFLLDKEKIKSRKMFAASSSHLLAALLVVYNQSDLSIITWYVSLAVCIGFVHMQSLRSVFTALAAAFLQLISSPINLVKKIYATHFGSTSLKSVIKPIKYIIIPIIILSLFIVLYSSANEKFAAFTELILTNISDFISSIFDLSFIRFLHILLGILITAAILIKFSNNNLEKIELKQQDELVRKRISRKDFHFGYELMLLLSGNLLKRKMALKTEYIIGIISFTALNVLIFSLNAIDVTTLWIGRTNLNINYSDELHNGTNALIMSIILAMLVILYFFSGNLNFYRGNKSIRLLAYVWIVQNAFLVCSVCLRDYQYIDMHGLTYKRIGVLIFLSLCVIGLVTVYLKVAKRKSFFYLCKTNGLTWYVLLLVAGFVNWDVLIVSYNIANKNSISLDLAHLQSLSNKTLPILDQNRKLLKSYYAEHNGALPKKDNPYGLQEFDDKLDQSLAFRIDWFKKKWDETSWLSWNYRDWQTHQYLVRKQ